MFGRRKVLFLKILQKSFVFLQKTANQTNGRGKFLYNSPVFGEFLRVLRYGLAELEPLFQDVASHDPGGVE